MNTENDSRWRPHIHYSPREHWMNDPCGLIYHHGTYHLHYQYHPFTSSWGSMHWGHAVSSDLFHWEEKEIALAPDPVNGEVYSGSAVLDSGNTSGCFEREGIAVLYTGALPTEDPAYPIQQQCLACSTDGYVWKKHPHGPVIRNDGSRDFRDPRVLFHEATGEWVMVLAAGEEVRFYRSVNLRQWELAGSLALGRRPLECPELLRFTVEGAEKWVLTVHNDGAEEGVPSGCRYLVGSFDGRTFLPDPGIGSAGLRADYGFEFYAAQTWSNCAGRTVWIGWAGRPSYSHDIPTVSWRNLLSLPRELDLVRSGGEYHLTQQPVSEIERLRDGEIFCVQAGEGTVFRIVDDQPVELAASVELNCVLTVTLHFGENHYVSVVVDNRARVITLDRSACGMEAFGERWRGSTSGEIPGAADLRPLSLRLFWDSCILELFAAEGLYSATSLVFPPRSLSAVVVTGELAVRLFSLRASMKFGQP
jgi:fructan beta-fructosidase